MTALTDSREGSWRSCALVTGLCVAVQLVLGGHVSLFGAAPNFLLCAVFFVALRAGCTPGVLAGFFLGLLFDLLGTSTVGISSLAGCVFAYACASVWTRATLARPVRAAGAFTAASLAYNLACAALMSVLGMLNAPVASLIAHAALTCLLDGAFALIVLAAYAGLSGVRRMRLHP